jgi:hypothetical protein
MQHLLKLFGLLILPTQAASALAGSPDNSWCKAGAAMASQHAGAAVTAPQAGRIPVLVARRTNPDAGGDAAQPEAA